MSDSRDVHLKAFLAARDVACPMCGYNVRGLTKSACPECGAELELTVGMALPRMGWFIAGLAGLAAGAGFNGLMLLPDLWSVTGGDWRNGWHRPPDQLTWLLLCAAGMNALLVVWMVTWRWVGLMAGWQRCVLAGLCWAMSVASASVYFGVAW